MVMLYTVCSTVWYIVMLCSLVYSYVVYSLLYNYVVYSLVYSYVVYSLVYNYVVYSLVYSYVCTVWYTIIMCILWYTMSIVSVLCTVLMCGVMLWLSHVTCRPVNCASCLLQDHRRRRGDARPRVHRGRDRQPHWAGSVLWSLSRFHPSNRWQLMNTVLLMCLDVLLFWIFKDAYSAGGMWSIFTLRNDGKWQT